MCEQFHVTSKQFLITFLFRGLFVWSTNIFTAISKLFCNFSLQKKLSKPDTFFSTLTSERLERIKRLNVKQKIRLKKTRQRKFFFIIIIGLVKIASSMSFNLI